MAPILILLNNLSFSVVGVCGGLRGLVGGNRIISADWVYVKKKIHRMPEWKIVWTATVTVGVNKIKKLSI